MPLAIAYAVIGVGDMQEALDLWVGRFGMGWHSDGHSGTSETDSPRLTGEAPCSFGVCRECGGR